MVSVVRLEPDEREVACRACLVEDIDDAALGRDLVANQNRSEILETISAVEPALAVVLRIVEMERSGGERDQERRRRFMSPARVRVANGLDEKSHMTSFNRSRHLGTVDADSGLDPVDCLRGSDHRPRGRPRTRSAMLLRWVCEAPA